MRQSFRLTALLLALAVVTALPRPDAFAAQNQDVQITLTDSYLFNALREQLGGIVIESSAIADEPPRYVIRCQADGVAAVKSLRLNNRYISDITGLEAFSALEELNIANNMIQDLSPLSGLEHLTALTAYGNKVSNVKPLLGLSNLRRLSLAKTSLKDNARSNENSVTSQISVLTGLEELDLSHNGLRYTNGLEKLTGLVKLELYSNYIRDLSGLEGLKNLTFLNLGENNETSVSTITGLSALKSLRSLRWLDFSQGNTPDIVSYVEDLGELEYLCLNQNQIVNIDGLSKLAKLKELELAYNKITSLKPLTELSALESLCVQSNKILTLADVVTGNALVWSSMKKLDTSSNWGDNSAGKNQMWRTEELRFLRGKYEDGSLEWKFNYNPVYDPTKEGLPHTDGESGVKYVTYEDFGARCDGVFDDSIAMRNAHDFANSYANSHPEEAVEVRGVPGKTYHYFNEIGSAVTVSTDVDWRGATIVLHDEGMERRYGRGSATRAFRLSNTSKDERITFTPSWTIGTYTKSLADKPEVMDAVAKLTAIGKSYDEFFCIVKNADHKQFIRYGSNANSGVEQQDRFKIDAAGNLLHDVMWDFEKITSFEIFPVSKTPFRVQNLNLLTLGAESLSQEAISRSGKNIYWYRQLCFSACSNVQISNFRHTVEPDEIGSYFGCLLLNDTVDAEITDSYFFAHKTNNTSTYDLTMHGSVNVRLVNLDSNDILDRTRWGVTCTHYTKYVTYENCRLNHADIHEGVYNWTVRDSEIGTICLIGRGEANIINTTLYDDDFIDLRQDYGTTFDGTVNIIDCTFHYWGQYIQALMKSRFAVEGDHIHKFGYDLRFPNVYVENLTIDSADAPPKRNYMLLLTNWSGEGAELNPKEYWPDSFVINGYRLVNSGHLTPNPDAPFLQCTASPEGKLEDVNFVITDCRVKLHDETHTDITRRVFQGNAVETEFPVTVTVRKNDSAENTVDVFRDGAPVVTAETVADTFERTFREAGSYRVVIHSYQALRYWGDIGNSKNDWNYYNRGGEKTLEFTISGSGTPETAVNAVILPVDSQEPLSAIPGGSFRVQADISPGQMNMTGACLWFAGYSQEGKLLEIQSREISNSASVTFSVKNQNGHIKNAKLFLLSEHFVPLCAPTDIISKTPQAAES